MKILKKLIFVSTDQFFLIQKNTENDPISLINTYGKTKFLGEFFYVISNHFILRTNIIGPIGKLICKLGDFKFRK